MQQNTSPVLALFFSPRKIHTHLCTHTINPAPKSRILFFLLSFLTFLFPCIVHCFLSSAQTTFLFPTLYQSRPKSSIPFFSFPSLRLALVSLCYVLADERNMLLHTNAFSIGNYVLAISDNI